MVMVLKSQNKIFKGILIQEAFAEHLLYTECIIYYVRKRSRLSVSLGSPSAGSINFTFKKNHMYRLYLSSPGWCNLTIVFLAMTLLRVARKNWVYRGKWFSLSVWGGGERPGLQWSDLSVVAHTFSLELRRQRQVSLVYMPSALPGALHGESLS